MNDYYRLGIHRNLGRTFRNNGPPLAYRSVKTRAPLVSSHSGVNSPFEVKLASLQNAPLGRTILSAANKYLGTPYQMGGGRGAGPVRTLDCSSFVSRVYADATGGRVKLTAYTDALYDETVPISPAEAQPGDLVLYRGHDPSQPRTKFPHVAIYAGNGQVVDASSMTGRVAYHPIGIGPRYAQEFRRVVRPSDGLGGENGLIV
ncbi:MAG: C40 family peptidase [Chloroflexi bacterium]|nr:C40 family peptidase [Chloroflexota bacterium]